MKMLLTLAALAALSTLSVGCRTPVPDTVVYHHTTEKPVYRTQTKTRYVAVPTAPAGPPTTVPGSPQQLADPHGAGSFRATAP